MKLRDGEYQIIELRIVVNLDEGKKHRDLEKIIAEKLNICIGPSMKAVEYVETMSCELPGPRWMELL